MERTPQKAPLPCYGLENNTLDPRCQACPHSVGCRELMGSRLDKVPLDRLTFDIVPKSFRLEAFEMDDPELPHLRRLYTDCYMSVFRKNPVGNAFLAKEAIAANARRAKCSVRMFLLANMVAHKVHQAEIIEHTEKARPSTFNPKSLATKFSVKRAEKYQAMCADEFGTFSLTSLAVLTDSEDKDDMESIMLNSEITAARWIVRYKIKNGGPPEQPMYESEELRLAPEWLAIEDSYINLILRPYIDRKIKSTEAIEQHRFNVFQVHCYYKRHLNHQKLAFTTRQRILPEALKHVMSAFNHRPGDFLHPRTPVTDLMGFWKSLGLTIRHYHCWLYLEGEQSYFTPRRNEVLIPIIPRS